MQIIIGRRILPKSFNLRWVGSELRSFAAQVVLDIVFLRRSRPAVAKVEKSDQGGGGSRNAACLILGNDSRITRPRVKGVKYQPASAAGVRRKKGECKSGDVLVEFAGQKRSSNIYD
jgi:hypothetical protein